MPRPRRGVGGTPGLSAEGTGPRTILTVKQVLMSVQTFPSPVYLGKQLQTACPGGEGNGLFHREILLALAFQSVMVTVMPQESIFGISKIFPRMIIVILHFSTLHSSTGIAYIA